MSRRAAPDPSDFFRPEAMAAARDRMGSPVRPLGPASWMLLCFMAALVIAVVAFLGAAHYARKETVIGLVTPAEGAVRIIAQRSGIISRVWVQDGQRVVAGQRLIDVSYDPTLQSGGVLSDLAFANLAREIAAFEDGAAARERVNDRQAVEAATQKRGLMADVKRLEYAMTLQARRNELQRQTVAAAQTLTEKGLMAALTLRQRQDALLAGEQALSQYERERDGAQSRIAQLEASMARQSAQSAADRADAVANRARYQEKQTNAEASRGAVLVAPQDGIVAALQARQGATAEPGRTLAIVLADRDPRHLGRLEAELWAPSRAIGFVRPGQSVRLMYDAFPYTVFGVGKGVVTSVARAPTNPNDLPVPIETREALYRVRVALLSSSQTAYGRDWPLSPGMRLTADLVLEDRSFLAWLLDPLLAAQKRAGT